MDAGKAAAKYEKRKNAVEAVMRGEPVPGFWKLVKQKRKARTGINPSTKQKIKIPAKTVLKFHVAKAAKDAIFGVKK